MNRLLLTSCIASALAFTTPVANGQGKKKPAFPAAKATVSLTGTCVFDGEVPKPRKLPVAGDDFCVECYKDGMPKKPAYEIDAKTKAIAYCFVYVKGLGKKWSFPVPKEPVHLEQHQCQYVPHTFGIMVGQQLIVKNTDKTDHNVHFFGRRNRLRKANFSQSAGKADKLKFKRPEVAKFKCDIHGWMSTNCHIMRHPVFAVTKKDGKFALPKLPAGSYEVVAWHEKWKSQPQKVTITAGEAPKPLTFKFK